MYFHRFLGIYIDFHRISWISIDFDAFEWFWDQNVGHPVASCGGLCHPVPACAAGLDPPNIKISDSGGLALEGWCLDAGCWKDWNGLQ